MRVHFFQAVLTNLEKLNSLPKEMQNVLFNDELEKTIPVPLPSIKSPERIEKKESSFPTFSSLPSVGTSVTTKLMNQMKNLSMAPTTSSSSTTDISNGHTKKSSGLIAAFPPRSTPSTFDDYERESPTPTASIDTGIRFGTTPAPCSTSM